MRLALNSMAANSISWTSDHLAACRNRIELARLWLNEEWFADSGSGEDEPTSYEQWLHQILNFITTRSMDKEKGTAFTQFLVDLPEIPKAEIGRLARMCTDTTG